MRPLFLPLLTFFLLSISTLASAQGYTPIVGIPGMADNNSLSTEGYVQALYKLSITAACLIALVKIIWAGVKWTLSDVVTDKGSAKKDIWSALFGLLIILCAVLVLNTINPNLTKLNIFGDAPSLEDIEGTEPPPPRTEVDQCPTGTTYTLSVTGEVTCVTSLPTLEEDYRDDPDAGQAWCGPTLTYNAVSNTCDQIQEVYAIPDYVLQSIEENADGDAFWYQQNGRNWCQSAYPGTDFDVDNKTCVPDSAF